MDHTKGIDEIGIVTAVSHCLIKAWNHHDQIQWNSQNFDKLYEIANWHTLLAMYSQSI